MIVNIRINRWINDTHLISGGIAAVKLFLLATIRILLWGLDHLDVRHSALDNDVVGPEIFVGFLVDHQKLRLIRKSLYALNNLLMSLVCDVDFINLDDSITLS